MNEIEQHNSRPSIINLSEKFSNCKNIGIFQLSSVNTPEILKLFKNIEDKKAAETYKIPSKLRKLSVVY